jgi:ribonuclease HII
MLKTFINVNKIPFFINEEKMEDGTTEVKKYNKREVFLSKQLDNALKQYCRETLKNETQFWKYTNIPSNSIHKINIDKLSLYEKNILNTKGNSNLDDLILFQFKKKNEIYIKKS